MNITGIKSEWFNYSSSKLPNGNELAMATLKDEYKDEMKSYIASQINTNYSTDRLELNDEQLKTLKDKYNLENMSEDEYKYFLDDLVDMGAITESEKYTLGGVKNISGFDLVPVGFGASASTYDASKGSSSFDIGSTEWIKYKSACDTVYFDSLGNSHKSNENILFDYVSDIISKAENLY